MTTRSDFSQIAEQMLHDYDAHTPGTTFADGFRVSISDAYRLQAQIADLRELRGEHVGAAAGSGASGPREAAGVVEPRELVPRGRGHLPAAARRLHLREAPGRMRGAHREQARAARRPDA